VNSPSEETLLCTVIFGTDADLPSRPWWAVGQGWLRVSSNSDLDLPGSSSPILGEGSAGGKGVEDTVSGKARKEVVKVWRRSQGRACKGVQRCSKV